MTTKIAYIGLLVHDQDEALAFYTEKFGFVTQMDVSMQGMRWLVVSPPGQPDVGFTLMPATTEAEKQTVGKQMGGRIPLCVLTTDDFWKTYEELKGRGVTFIDEPMDNPWGVAAQLVDLYGNKFDLNEPKPIG